MIFPWHAGSLPGPRADILLIHLAPAVVGSDPTPRPQEGFQAGEFVPPSRFEAPHSGYRRSDEEETLKKRNESLPSPSSAPR